MQSAPITMIKSPTSKNRHMKNQLQRGSRKAKSPSRLEPTTLHSALASNASWLCSSGILVLWCSSWVVKWHRGLEAVAFLWSGVIQTNNRCFNSSKQQRFTAYITALRYLCAHSRTQEFCTTNTVEKPKGGRKQKTKNKNRKPKLFIFSRIFDPKKTEKWHFQFRSKICLSLFPGLPFFRSKKVNKSFFSCFSLDKGIRFKWLSLGLSFQRTWV